MTTGEKEVRWIEHYNSAQKILLVGEGDFSFSAALAGAFGSAANMVATSLHSYGLLLEKHSTSEAHLETLGRLGCLVLHEVDVHEMSQHSILKDMKFDVVVYNFPHAGHFVGLKEKDAELIKMHKELLRGFFRSAREMVKEGGEVHVTHRDDGPYKQWEVENLADRAGGFKLKEKVKFKKGHYPGYDNKRGGDINSNKSFFLGSQCFTFKFSLNHTVQQKLDDDAVEALADNSSTGGSVKNSRRFARLSTKFCQ